jgi:hypothetical protein
MSRDGNVKQGKPKSNVTGHRAMFLYLLHCNDKDEVVDG